MPIALDNEDIIVKYQVFYYKNLREQIVGDLIITKDRTTFQSKKNVFDQVHFEYANKDILRIDLFKSLHIIPDGLKVTLTSHAYYNFKVIDRQKIIDAYDTAKAML